MLRTSRAIAALIFAASLGLPARARAQEPVAPRPSPRPTSPDRPTLDLSLDGSVKPALENNHAIAVERNYPVLSRESLRACMWYYVPRPACPPNLYSST